MNRPNYEIYDSAVRQMRVGNFVRVQIENLGSPKFLPALRIGNFPPIDLTPEQLKQISSVLQMDEIVYQVISMLHKNVIHGNDIVKKTLVKIFDNSDVKC